MKQLLIIFILFIVAFPASAVQAQGPIGTPLAPAPGSGGQGQPLPPMPLPIGQPLPDAPEQYAPTWSAPLPTPIPPTPVNFDWYDVVALQIVSVRTCPALTCYVITRLLPGDVVTVRWAGPGWLQLESGYAAGSYILDDARIRRV